MTNSDPETPNKTVTVNSLEENKDSDSLLFCKQERLDQHSPELWPEQIPGVNEFLSSSLFASPDRNVIDKTLESIQEQELTKDDYDMLQELGSLSVTQIMDKFQNLKQQAYNLGLEEAREMTRGKFLNVLGKAKNTSITKKKPGK